jgi:predicted ester cyclase
MKGPVDFKPFHARFRGAFPDIDVIVEDTIAEGDMVVARCSVRGRHTGDQLGVAASNAPVEFTGIAIARVKDGKIVEAWNNFDFLRMNKQIGAI